MGCVAVVFVLVLVTPGEAAAAPRFGMQILPTYFSGDFGSNANTDILYVLLILGLSSERQDLRASIPFLTIRTDEPVTFVGGDVIGRPPKTGSVGPSTESGVGDIVLKDEVYLARGDERWHPWVSVIGRVKLPTANEKQGLGTGEFDYGPGAGLIQPLGGKWSLLVEVDYVVRGDPPGVDLRNTLWNSAGVQLKPTSTAAVYLFYDSRQTVLTGRETIRDVTLGYDHRLSDTVTFRSAAYYGLSSSAEDFGLSLGFVMKEGVRSRED
jgi:outer membrane putative beta-barrel porin/alpha-amylase